MYTQRQHSRANPVGFPTTLLTLQQDYIQIMPKMADIRLNHPVFINMRVVEARTEDVRVSFKLPPFLQYQIINPRHPYWLNFTERLQERPYSWRPCEQSDGEATCMARFNDGSLLVDDLIKNGLLFSVFEGNYDTDFNCRLALSASASWYWE